MSRVYRPVNDDVQAALSTRDDVAAHLLRKIQSNTSRLIGTEIELFVKKADGAPLPFDEVELVLDTLGARLAQTHMVTMLTEKNRTIGLDIKDVGVVCLEPGGQIELASVPCADITALTHANTVLREALNAVAEEYGYSVIGAGHDAAFLNAQDVPRSRFAAYYQYCFEQHGAAAQDLIDTMKSCCGLQVNIDCGGDDFADVYKSLMLLEMASAFSAPTTRQKRFHDTYAPLFPEQTTPLFAALHAPDAETIVQMMADRLLELKLPFLPDAHSPEGFVSTSVNGKTPSLGDFLKEGALTPAILDNALSLQLMPPNIRRHGVLETRVADAVQNTADITAIAAIYKAAAYDTTCRTAIAALSDKIDPKALRHAYESRFDADAKTVHGMTIGNGYTVANLIADTQAALAPARKISRTLKR